MIWIKLRNLVNSWLYDIFVVAIVMVAGFVMLEGRSSTDQFSVYYLVVFIMALLYLPKWLLRHLIREQQRREDRRINLTSDAGGEKRFTRALTDNERAYLRKTFTDLWKRILLKLAAGLFMGWYVYVKSKGEFDLKLCLLGGAVFGCMGAFQEFQKNQKYYLDLRTDAVMQAEGDLIREIQPTKRGRIVHFLIRGLRFSSKEINPIEQMCDRFAEDEGVRIEFSPHSKLTYRLSSLSDPNKSFDLTQRKSLLEDLSQLTIEDTDKPERGHYEDIHRTLWGTPKKTP